MPVCNNSLPMCPLSSSRCCFQSRDFSLPGFPVHAGGRSLGLHTAGTYRVGTLSLASFSCSGLWYKLEETQSASLSILGGYILRLCVSGEVQFAFHFSLGGSICRF